ncbi:hypothetical protein [Amycolatopsis sp. NPDC051102]|uniref:hypothetical protein n=1 Tax=Amycolatopsis sp. NPDC051102 TaxID=3155163 RepID=UPI0034238DC7
MVAWVAPPSPVKERVQPVLNAAFKPYFQQTWTLFSPNDADFVNYDDTTALAVFQAEAG